MDSLGWVYYKKKLYKKSLEILEKAVQLDKEEGVIWEHIGDSHVALGDKKKALENYKEALLRKNEARDQSRIQKKFDDLNAELRSGR
jgi:tetratricopeptide (TPR) repeat protein